MSGELAKEFLNDIVANIDDDTPRLVYADWLTENGQDDRAEFIRIQIERTRLPDWDPSQVRLRLREEELLKENGEKWLSELPLIEGAKWEGFRRGIVAEVTFASFEAMRTNAHACRAVAPVEAVTVQWPRRVDRGTDGSPIAELRELSLTGRPDSEDEIAWLAESPQLSTLRALTGRGLWYEGWQRLTASPLLGNLKSLRIPASNLGNAGILALVQAKSLVNLEDLDLSGRGREQRYNDDPIVRSPGMEALANWPGLSRMRSLTLSENDLGRAGIRALVRSRRIGALKSLSLRGGRLDGQAIAEFRDAHAALRLETLDLGENVLKEIGVAYLATAPCLQELRMLLLDRCEIPLTGARQLAKAKFLHSLRILDVAHNHFGPAGVTSLLQQSPSSLHTLRLRDNDLFDRGATILAESPATNSLLELDLCQNYLTTAGALALGQSENLRELLILRLLENSIHTQFAVPHLSASPLGKRLKVMELVEPPPPPTPAGMMFDDDLPY